MKIRLSDGGSANPAALARLETALGARLSPSFREFVARHDGAKPELNLFLINGVPDGSVNRFIPVEAILKERGYLRDIPHTAYPVARDGLGNYVLIDEGDAGRVVFWEHETDDLQPVARNFDTFLELLEPLDPASVQLDPKDVKKVWLRHDFWEKFGHLRRKD